MQIDWFPFWLSLRVASLATVLSLVAGLALAYLFANVEFRGKILLDAFVTLPLVLPPTVLGYYLLVLLGRLSPFGKFYEAVFGGPLVFTWQAAVIASTVHAIPLLVRSTRAALSSVEHSYERAARSLGAREWRIFWRISVPLAQRQIVAATVLAFARSLGDFGATLMVAGDIPHRTQTVSVAIYDAVEGGHTLTAKLLVLAVSGLTIAIVYFANHLERKTT